MSRESIPTFDLYAELEVSRSASVATIEAAYRSLAKRVHPDVATPRGFTTSTASPTGPGRSIDGHIKRLNIAREWLTDPERRRRYDAITAPRPAPTAPAAPGSARPTVPRNSGALVTTPPAGRGYPVPTSYPGRRVGVMGTPELESPRRGLWGTDAERTRWLAVAGLGASSLALTAVLALSLLGGATQHSVGEGSPPSLVAAIDGVTSGSSPGQASQPAAPSPSLASVDTIDPALLADLRASAASTLQRLRRAARIGNLRGAQALLGQTAPGLRVSGLMRAHFPNVGAGSISVARTADGWQASVGTDTLASTDGTHWTFDYGERPLAVYGRTSEHMPYFIDPDGRHEVDVRVTSLVVTRSTVRVSLSWRYPSATDAAAFTGDRLTSVSITMGSASHQVPDAPSARLGGSAGAATLTLPVGVGPATRGSIDIRVIHGTGAFGSVDTIFKLAIS